MTYRLVLVDLDDTLFDFGRSQREAFDRTLVKVGLPASDEQTFVQFAQINQALWADLERGLVTKDALRGERFRRLFAQKGWAAPVESASAAFLEFLSQGSHLIDGAESVCRTLAARVPLVAVTNGMVEVQKRRLAASPLAPWVSHLIISDEVGVAKPDPAIFDHALALAGHIDRSTVLMVGDSWSADIRGGQNAGIDTCWYNPVGRPAGEGAPATHEIRTLVDLISLVAGDLSR